MNIIWIILLSCSSFLSVAEYKNISNYEQHVSYMKTTLINGKKIAYLDEGKKEGKPLFLLHGIPTNSWMFRKIIPSLVESGYRVIVPDLLNAGASDRSKKSSEITLQSQASLMISLIVDHLRLKKWSHVVHDMGGPITWEMMKDDRFNVEKFVFLNTVVFKEGFSPKLNFFTRIGIWMMTTRYLRKGFYNTAIREMVTRKEILDIPMCLGYLEPLMSGSWYLHRSLYFKANKLKKKLTAYQERIKLKLDPRNVLVVWGEDDDFLSAHKQSSQLKALLDLQDHQIHILKNTKHLLTEERPKVIGKLITNHLKLVN